MDGLPEKLVASGAVEIVRALGRLDAGHVLDVATGNGDFIATLTEVLGDWSTFTGVDVNSEKLEEGRERFEDEPVDLIEMDGGDMSFEAGTFDTVCISNSLHHLERSSAVMAEMLRVLRSSGTFILQEMFSDGEQSPSQSTHILNHHWSARVDTLLGSFHRKTYTRKEIRSIVDLLDLRDVMFFETTHGVKCLTCDDRFRCEDPLEPEFIRSEIEDIEENLEKLESSPDREQAEVLKEEGKALIDRVRTTGDTSASTMFLIGRK